MCIRNQVIAHIVLIGILAMAAPQTVHALTFEPTETEWATWPEYCRARYVVSGAGKNSQFVTRVSSDDVARYETLIGHEAWKWLHHYCAGLVYMTRAKARTNPKEADYLLETAERQFMGQYIRVSKGDPFFADLATTLGRLYRQWGDPDSAMKYLNEAMDAHPEFPSSYSLASLVLRDQGKLDKAREVLLRGNNACAGSSAEIHYFLGLVLIELRDPESALEHAKRAYSLGYPLPGLRQKLQRLGYSLG